MNPTWCKKQGDVIEQYVLCNLHAERSGFWTEHIDKHGRRRRQVWIMGGYMTPRRLTLLCDHQ